MRRKLIVVFVVCIAIFAGMYIRLQQTKKKLKFQTAEVGRYRGNLYNANFRIDSLQHRNGNYQYQVNSLFVTVNDLKVVNYDLVKRLDLANLQIKNLQNLMNIQSQFIISLRDSLSLFKTNVIVEYFDSISYEFVKIFNVAFVDEWINLNQNIQVSISPCDTETLSLVLREFNQTLTNDFVSANELIYTSKRWWQFWKKRQLEAIKTHIITDNPYLNIQRIETYQIIPNDEKFFKNLFIPLSPFQSK